MTNAPFTDDQLACRAAVYRLLARLWRREIDAATLEQLLAGSVRKAYLAAGGSLPEVADQATCDALAGDYCQLFLGPAGHLPPYQSVWSDGQFHGAAAQSLRGYLSLLRSHDWDRVDIEFLIPVRRRGR